MKENNYIYRLIRPNFKSLFLRIFDRQIEPKNLKPNKNHNIMNKLTNNTRGILLKKQGWWQRELAWQEHLCSDHVPAAPVNSIPKMERF
jgi:hypothetical protein